jgi:hypothetical protein
MNDQIGYAWLYLSFCILRLADRDEEKESSIVVCFDDCNKIKEAITKGFQALPVDHLVANPLAVEDVVMKVIASEYDKALWRFRKPVREIEKVTIHT